MSVEKAREMFQDPDLPDENDPDSKLEMFEIYKEMGWISEDLPGLTEIELKEYAKWLSHRNSF